MAHVQIKQNEERPMAYEVIVDGVDLSPHVLRRGLSIEIPTDPDKAPTVTLVIVADDLDVDLPYSLIKHAQMTEDELAAPRRICDPLPPVFSPQAFERRHCDGEEI
jgi:hypothetical protein